MSQVSDLVKDAKLPTKLDAEFTTHTFLDSILVAGRRSRRRERQEVWKKLRHLGIGICGTTWLEECALAGGSNLRAVREVRKMAPGSRLVDYSRELEAMVKLSQRQFDGWFVKSSGWFEDDESIFVCMEYMALGDLQRYAISSFPEKEVQSITLQLLEALDFMHRNGFTHRDLNPSNIFVLNRGPDWWVKIGDFGLKNRVMEGFAGSLTFNGAPSFIAPEIFESIWNPDTESFTSSEDLAPKADIWSLGVITYYLLTCKLPFPRRTDLLAYTSSENTLPETYLSQQGVSPDTYSFLRSMLASNPSMRPSAKDALEHAWLKPLQDELEAEDLDETDSVNPDPKPSPLNTQASQNPEGTLPPPKVDYTCAPTAPFSIPSPTSLGLDGDSYKQLVNSLGAGTFSNLNHPTADTLSIAQSNNSESQCSEPTRIGPDNDSNLSSGMPQSDTLPPYVRRRSDAAPIPITDLAHDPPRPDSMGSSNRNSIDTRFSDTIRRVSGNMISKRVRASDPGKRESEEKKKEKDKKKKESNIESSATSSGKAKARNKSQIVEIPHRPQFGESLPLFPMRTKKA